MRKYKFDEYIKKNLPEFSLQKGILFSSGKLPRRKERKKEEWDVFFELSKYRWEKWLKEKKIRKTGNRKFEIKL